MKFPQIAIAVFACSLLGCNAAGLGDSCESHSDCKSGLQCFTGVCTQQCESHFACGDGHVCDSGECTEVVSAIGDACERELDCGIGQACQLDSADVDGDGVLGASCAADTVGKGTAVACGSDADCRNGTCALGHCTQLCQVGTDCPSVGAAALGCFSVPRIQAGGAEFKGCLQSTGVLVHEFSAAELSGDFAQEIDIAIPSHAHSFALVTSVGNGQWVGADSVVSPSGRVLYSTPDSPEAYVANPIRHEPAQSVSTLLVPNNPAVDLETGVYRATVASFLDGINFLARNGSVRYGTEAPRVKVFYKLSDSAVLDLHFHFADLADHPCGGAMTVGNAAAAEVDTDFQQNYLPALKRIFEDADINIGAITYRDTARPELDSIDSSKLPTLLAQGSGETGLNIFFVRNIDPVGVQALAGGNPSPPPFPGGTASGIVIGADTLCYRSWGTVARITAHAMGQSMGLYLNRGPTGEEDPIVDSADDEENLMFFGDFGGTELSPGQRQVLRAWPGLR